MYNAVWTTLYEKARQEEGTPHWARRFPGLRKMDLTFNVLESLRRDIRELRDDLSNEKATRNRQIDELTKDVKDIRRYSVESVFRARRSLGGPFRG